jgi:hypothetical protein
MSKKSVIGWISDDGIACMEMGKAPVGFRDKPSEYCKHPVRITLLGQELKPRDEPRQWEVPFKVQVLAATRWVARNAKQWAEADRLRDKLQAMGYVVRDGKDGYEILPPERYEAREHHLHPGRWFLTTLAPDGRRLRWEFPSDYPGGPQAAVEAEARRLNDPEGESSAHSHGGRQWKRMTTG